MTQPFCYALAKGRGRYVCHIKLAQQADGSAMEDGLFDDADASIARDGANGGRINADGARRQKVYATMLAQLDAAAWDGDRDTLEQSPQADDWAAIAADRHSCTARHCPRFRDCSYYRARAGLANANVIVANHDLVLASLGMKTLPELDNCLVVFDEAHHLPAIALDQFSGMMDLSNLRWLDRLPRLFQETSEKLAVPVTGDIAASAAELKSQLSTLARSAMLLVHESTGARDGLLRFPNGILPEALQEPVRSAGALAGGLSRIGLALGQEAKTLAKQDPARATEAAQIYARLGSLADRLEAVHACAELLLEHQEQPLAKWLQAASENGYLNMSAHACPIVPGDVLRQFLWPLVRGAVLTSASLRSCASFDYFLEEAGLGANPAVTAIAVSSPFDYPVQGRLTVVKTRTDPKNAAHYTAEMVRELIEDVALVQHGALALFTSRSQMAAAVQALPARLAQCVQVQGTVSRSRLLDTHQTRVQAGLPSVIFGLQSFAEGLDLPGKLCETLMIAKLPFAPPSDPVDEARAEWLRSLGRDPFAELVIPATGIRLLQWTGRAIRVETDRAEIICYDRRLVDQAYGRRLLSGLPPYPVQERAARPRE
jgi:ATP-dependent DNA helicase DinG